jgi:hypothetical protein
MLAIMPGNPALTADPAVLKAWDHWRSANWHSILTEQGVGLLYGLGIVLAMAMLARRVRPHIDHPRLRRWTQAFSVVFILNMLVYVNLVKNVAQWTALRQNVFQAVPKLMKPPLLDIGPYSAYAWFNSIFLLITIATIILLIVHLRRRLAIVPATWLGRGQLFYLAFLWPMVIGNFERALVGFSEHRLGTEWTIFVNAVLAMLLILCFPREHEPMPSMIARPRYGLWTAVFVFVGLTGLALGTTVFTAAIHRVYGERHDNWGGVNLRIGPNADWRMHPILKSKQHR